MKKFLLIVAVAWMAAVNGWAQRLQVLDSEGNPIPYASVLTPQADRAYVTKTELKDRKKANKMKLNYANIRQFERDHNIPALAPAVQQKLNELWKADD